MLNKTKAKLFQVPPGICWVVPGWNQWCILSQTSSHLRINSCEIWSCAMHLWDVASAPYFSVYIPQYSSHKDMTHKSNWQKTHCRLFITSPQLRGAMTEYLSCIHKASAGMFKSRVVRKAWQLLWWTQRIDVSVWPNERWENRACCCCKQFIYPPPFVRKKARRRHPWGKKVFIMYTVATMTADQTWSCSIPWILNSHQCMCVPAGCLPDSDVFESRRNGHIYEMGRYNVVLTIWNLRDFLKG